MIKITAKGVEDAYETALWHMHLFAKEEDSRNGKVKVIPEPVCTVYHDPRQRMLQNYQRDANPFFHVVEAMWMLAGRNDVESVAKYAARIASFSDDGKTINGAYGYRWRDHFAVDQLTFVVDMLRTDLTTRRAVLTMWDAREDLANTRSSKDVPCNTHIYFRVVDGKLDMTVCCRSNDIIWGCYGANVVHMSFLQEFVALSVGVPLGKYYQVSNNWHIYERHFPLLGKTPVGASPWYNYDTWTHIPLFESGNIDKAFLFMTELDGLFEDILIDYVAPFQSPYLDTVVKPMLIAHKTHKDGDTKLALVRVEEIADSAIRNACQAWLYRRQK